MINVTKAFLPSLEEYSAYLAKIWETGHVTNRGPLVMQLERDLLSFLSVQHLRFVNNGTIALQIAIKALGLKGEIITTPFSYVATTSSIAWEGCTPIFADIDPQTLTIDPEKVEAAITPKTSAILATHVFGNPCDVEALERIARKHDIGLIYDAAHCFGSRYLGRSLLDFGDISTLSFHATKIFHTGEGGAVVCKLPELDKKISSLMNFGHVTPEEFDGVGINGKPSELNAAMGLCILPKVPSLIQKRKAVSELYDKLLAANTDDLVKPAIRPGTEYNYGYYPVIFPSESVLLKAKARLNEVQIFPRRYFYPSLSKLNYVEAQPTPVSDDISSRIMCLPLHAELEAKSVEQICNILNQRKDSSLGIMHSV